MSLLVYGVVGSTTDGQGTWYLQAQQSNAQHLVGAGG
jgi:hypothetical protein